MATAPLLLVSLAACAPKARPLAGTPAPAVALPSTALATQPQRLVFRWRYQEQDGFTAGGDGVARVVPPDSGRLDFFLDGGLGGGYAILTGDRLSVPGGPMVERVLPPPPLLWAALGRLALPAGLRDTIVRLDGDTLRADVGGGTRWRATFADRRLVRLERIDAGRVIEWVTRAGATIRYQHTTARRSLAIDLQRSEFVDGFPASIWTR